MTQLEIAGSLVLLFALFVFGYSLGWMQRGSRLGRAIADVSSPDAVDRLRDDLEIRARRAG
ncbi:MULTISPECIES: hypothetical protein [unclassified Bradyrhizobium]|uniref:hypothetical protein n=1 Tax=unclassified Bradyrhizobium TaxID=2631580 RepID=UPI001BABB432|nr:MULTISPECIES: hypothetical protein [unclassified Bradyrhizobium]WLA52354.1 hypothetical protein QIH80_21040 [Bradyrhizobium elkanii]MBR1206980.1 hypothetical protein [Bradyrhizobium sp. AUGA SZCCT0124]MBR1313519.1 hypothetical protein [Bradyrhizobium sp. AUGA SZCCT0051]MBR1343384.1 hypothetical protein [Bradyrhizobium sp. AUGA SZCCT0105]MBR1357196.1 hypothetical protein [Bradyrhizobium sp. AUGA SZCCT0045]